MKRPRKFRIRLARRWAGLTRRQRYGAFGLAALLIVAGLWLALAGAGPEPVALTDAPLSPEQRDRAAEALDAAGIPYERQGGHLLVAVDDLARAQGAVTPDTDEIDPAAALHRLADSRDIWSSAAQKSQRWQATKMLTLGRLIERFDGVASATVLFEPGSPPRLGAPGVAPTAVVNVTLAPGTQMTDLLVEAIADHVAGLIPDMKSQAVRVIDSSGKSYRAATAGALSDLTRAEAHYENKVRAALSYMDGLTVAAHVERTDGHIRCTGVSVGVPRTRLMSEHAAGDGDAFAASAAALTDSIQTCVQRVIGAETPDAVAVHWYADGPSAPATAVRRRHPTTDATSPGPAWAAGGAAALAAGTLLWLVRRRRKRPDGRSTAEPASPLPQATDASGAPPTDGDAAPAAAPFAALRDVPTDTLLAALRGQEPQIVALVLGHLPPDKAAAILGGLSGAAQVDVIRRISRMQPVDDAYARRIARSVSDRCTAAATNDPVGGPGAAAELLARAGPGTARGVLGALEDGEPALAETLRRRIFAFEDLTGVPAEALHAGLMELETDEVAVALMAADEPVVKKAMACLPASARRELRTTMDELGAVRVADVEAAQWRLVAAVRRAAARRGRYVSERAGRTNA